MSKDYKALAGEVDARAANLFKAAPGQMRAFRGLMEAATADGALDAKTKELMALSIAIATHCEGCIVYHTRAAHKLGATREEVAELMATARREAWRRKFVIDRDIVDAEPNRGHRAVAKLVRVGKVTSVITQNIDNLHQNSGILADQIIELHGNGTYASGLTCRTRYELGPIKEAFEADDTPPSCTFCGGHVKAATISFGQAMPDAEMARARQEALACDLMLAIGSSLVVYPAAGFPVLATENGAQLVILNREATDLDQVADLVINREIGPTLGEAANVN
jgi:NAD-dependent deacetylase